MRYLKLGKSGLDVSPIALGCMTYGEPARGHPDWSLPEEESRALIRQALEAGINFFDTANGYSDGSSEEILGRALADFADRDAVVIATKIRHPMRGGPNGGSLSRKAIIGEVERSLKRLRTDHIDLYQVHRMDHATPLEETLETLHDLVRAGKVRYLGASSVRAWEFAKALHCQARHGWTRFVSLQHHYNLLAREDEREMLPLCDDEGVSTIPRSPLARGRLVRSSDQATARARRDGFADMFYAQNASDAAIIEAVTAIAWERGVSRAAVALAWLRRRPSMAAPLIGVTRPMQLAAAIASLDLVLTDDEAERIEAPYTPRHDFQCLVADPEPPLPARLAMLPAA